MFTWISSILHYMYVDEVIHSAHFNSCDLNIACAAISIAAASRLQRLTAQVWNNREHLASLSNLNQDFRDIIQYQKLYKRKMSEMENISTWQIYSFIDTFSFLFFNIWGKNLLSLWYSPWNQWNKKLSWKLKLKRKYSLMWCSYSKIHNEMNLFIDVKSYQ